MHYSIRAYVETRVDVEAIQKLGEIITLREIRPRYQGEAVDVYDEVGNIVGSLIYVAAIGVRDLKE